MLTCVGQIVPLFCCAQWNGLCGHELKYLEYICVLKAWQFYYIRLYNSHKYVCFSSCLIPSSCRFRCCNSNRVDWWKLLLGFMLKPQSEPCLRKTVVSGIFKKCSFLVLGDGDLFQAVLAPVIFKSLEQHNVVQMSVLVQIHFCFSVNEFCKVFGQAGRDSQLVTPDKMEICLNSSASECFCVLSFEHCIASQQTEQIQ